MALHPPGGPAALRPISTSANLVARTGTVACSSVEKKQSDWLSLILVAKKLNLIQLPELTARSPVNARFQLGFRAAHALIAHRLIARPNSPNWKPALTSLSKDGVAKEDHLNIQPHGQAGNRTRDLLASSQRSYQLS